MKRGNMQGYKVFTHDLCSPIQGGFPVWDGTRPFELPKVKTDQSKATCGAGWNFVKSVATGLKIAGMWPNGRPSRVFLVESTTRVYARGDKLRTGQLVVIEEVTEEAINAAIYEFSAVCGNHAKHMAESQIAWRHALSRPHHNIGRIEEGLREALNVRDLSNWKLKRFESVRETRTGWDARTAWATWGATDARDAWDTWDARDKWNVWNARSANAKAAWDTRGAWDAKTALAALEAWDARDAKAAWTARDAWDARTGWDMRAAWAAWDAKTALTVEFASLSSLIAQTPDYLTRGLRKAYENGLEMVIPTGPEELGWVGK